MKNHNQFKKMMYLVELMQKRTRGSADDMAEKLHVSRRTFFRYVELLDLHGAEIKYDRIENCYQISSEFCFIEDFLKSAL